MAAVPVLGPALVRRRGTLDAGFTTSEDYWEKRYVAGGTSGAGSYNRLAEFKASFLNQFVADHDVRSVIEFGSGDGAQLQLAHYPDYVGVDVSETAVRKCRELFIGDRTKSFFQLRSLPENTNAELALSLDVIYHLVEDSVFNNYMKQLFGSATRYVIIYSSNMDQAWPAHHVRHRLFTAWVAQNKTNWRQLSHTPNLFPFDPSDQQNTSFADFYVFGLG